jgi:hypothetical protein
MKPGRAIGLVVGLIVLIGNHGPAFAEEPPPVPSQEQPEVLTRGPVHEAFAQPVELQAQAGLVAQLQPPANIEEVPPADRPEGEHFVWVPGYWSWDADRRGHIWVSACWRAAPPGMYWVPGYWTQVTAGWEWVPGFWARAGAQEIEYLPAPPALDNTQPQGVLPSPDWIWVPPCWYWTHDQYIHRPGYWLAPHPGWVWVPSHYVLTPRGYVFAEGHWDYSLERRGVLFAPVYFPPSVYGRRGFTYSPTIVVAVGGLRLSLFARPSYSHYYFGDYYDDSYVRIGIYPWCDSERLHTWYDPIYVYDRSQNRRADPRWEDHQRQEYDSRRADQDLRPSRTYREMETRLAKLPEARRQSLQIAQPLAVVVSSKAAPLKFQTISNDTRNNIAKQAIQVNRFREDRSRWESPAAEPKTNQPPVDQKDPVIRPPGRQQPVTPTPERKGPVVAPPDQKQPVTAPPDHNSPANPPVPFRPPTSPPIGTQAPAAVPVDNSTPPPIPSARAHPTQPERVKIPAPPIVGKAPESGNAGGRPHRSDLAMKTDPRPTSRSHRRTPAAARATEALRRPPSGRSTSHSFPGGAWVSGGGRPGGAEKSPGNTPGLVAPAEGARATKIILIQPGHVPRTAQGADLRRDAQAAQIQTDPNPQPLLQHPPHSPLWCPLHSPLQSPPHSPLSPPCRRHRQPAAFPLTSPPTWPGVSGGSRAKRPLRPPAFHTKNQTGPACSTGRCATQTPPPTSCMGVAAVDQLLNAPNRYTAVASANTALTVRTSLVAPTMAPPVL